MPEVKKLPSQYIYEPWLAPLSMQKQAGCVIGTDYPHRVVIHEDVHKENIKRMSAAYKQNKARKTEEGTANLSTWTKLNFCQSVATNLFISLRKTIPQIFLQYSTSFEEQHSSQ